MRRGGQHGEGVDGWRERRRRKKKNYKLFVEITSMSIDVYPFKAIQVYVRFLKTLNCQNRTTYFSLLLVGGGGFSMEIVNSLASVPAFRGCLDERRVFQDAFKTNSAIPFNEDGGSVRKLPSVIALHSQTGNYQTVDR